MSKYRSAVVGNITCFFRNACARFKSCHPSNRFRNFPKSATAICWFFYIFIGYVVFIHHTYIQLQVAVVFKYNTARKKNSNSKTSGITVKQYESSKLINSANAFADNKTTCYTKNCETYKLSCPISTINKLH